MKQRQPVQKKRVICNRDCFNCPYDDCYDTRTYTTDFEKKCQGFEREPKFEEHTIKKVELRQSGVRYYDGFEIYLLKG